MKFLLAIGSLLVLNQNVLGTMIGQADPLDSLDVPSELQPHKKMGEGQKLGEIKKKAKEDEAEIKQLLAEESDASEAEKVLEGMDLRAELEEF